jgi:3-oxoacyl-[acyl-carrier-protein] synthase III
MLLTRFDNFAISGIAVAAPENLLTVDSFNESFGSEVVANISGMTGIKSFRRTLPSQTAGDLGFIAASSLIKELNFNPEEIGILIYVTQKPDYRVPSTAFLLHHRLGLRNTGLCFDLNLACSGFIFGLHTIMSLLKNSDQKHALLITGDTTTKTISPVDRTMMMLFGDSGTATIISRSENENRSFSALRTDGNRFNAIITPSGAFRNRNRSHERVEWSDGISRSDYDTHMKGMDVFGFSISDVPKLMKEFMDELGTNSETYDYFVLHQPNLYMLKKISNKIKISEKQLLVSIDRYGNNSSSSIPLVLADHFGTEKAGEIRTLMCGFGSGLSWGCFDITIDTKIILPVLLSSEYYQEVIN